MTYEYSLKDENETDVVAYYSYTPGYRGTYYDPPEPAYVEVNEVRRKADGAKVELTEDEYWALAERIKDHYEASVCDGPPDLD